MLIGKVTGAEGRDETFPWQRMMQIGFGVLHLSPSNFWAVTPKELAQAIIGVTGGEIETNLSRADFNNLLQRFPDEEQNG